MPTLEELEARYDGPIPEDEKARALNADADLVKARRLVAFWRGRMRHARAVAADPAPGVCPDDARADVAHAEQGLAGAGARLRLLEAGASGRAAFAMAALYEAAAE